MSSPTFTEPTQPTPSRLPFTLPALNRYSLLVGLFVVFAFLLPFYDGTDVDFWWHLRTGQIIAETGIPHLNTMSIAAYGRPWIVDEWGIEYLMYLLSQVGGYPLLAVLFGLVQAGTLVLVYRTMRDMGAGRLLCLPLLLLFFSYVYPTWGVRPQILAAFFIAIFYYILLRYRRNPTSTRLLWLILPITLVWANMHASFIIGLALIGFFIVGEAINNWLYRPEHPTPLLPLTLALLGGAAVSLINPYFLEMWGLPLGYIFTKDRQYLGAVIEWAGPDFHQFVNLLMAASVLLLMFFGLAQPVSDDERRRFRLPIARYLDATAIILVAIFTVQALQGMYTFPLYGVIIVPLLAQSIARAVPALSKAGDSETPPLEGKLNWAIGTIASLLLAFLILTAPEAQTQPQARTGDYITPVAATDFVLKQPSTMRLFHEFDWGSYLFYRLYPTHQTFIDGRFNFFLGKPLEDFLTMQYANPGWRELMDEYKVNTILIRPGSTLDYALKHDHEMNWRVIYQDKIAIVYQRLYLPNPHTATHS